MTISALTIPALANALMRSGQSLGYWLGLLGLTVIAQGIGLYYQHGLGYWPCLVCIHTRLWFLALCLVALLGLAMRRRLVALAHLATVVIAMGLAERAWVLLGTERGLLPGDCGVDLSLPPWLPLDHWLPWAFEAWTACDYTPILAFGVSFAEALLALSVTLGLLAAILTLVTLWIRRE